MRRVNVKLLLSLAAIVVLTGGVLFLAHWLQRGSVARALLTRAERAEKQERLDQVVRYVSRYLELTPEDNEQRARLGRTLASEQLAVTPKARTRAIFVLEQVLGREPGRHDLRMRLTRLALELDRVDLAQQHLALLQQSLPDNGEVEDLWAQWAAAQKNWPEAAAWYRKAIAHAPRQVESSVRLADVLRRQLGPDKDGSQARDADMVMDRLVAHNLDNYRAHLARWRYRKQWTGMEAAARSAAENVTAALRLAPGEADVLVAAAELAQAQKDFAQARQHLQQGRQLHPQDVRMVRELALLELRQGRRADAVSCLREGAKSLTGPGQAEVLWTLANVLIDGGEVAPARAVVSQMARANASSAALDYLDARLQIEQGNWAEAVKLLERTRPLLAGSLELSSQVDMLLSQCFEQLDDPAAQLTALGRVIGRDPSALAARLNMAAALAAAGKIDEALAQYRQVSGLPGAPPTGWIEIARLLMLRELQRSRRDDAAVAAGRKPKRKSQDWTEVEEALDKAEATNPGAAAVTLLRAEVLLAKGQNDAARELLTLALAKHKDQVQLYAALASLAVATDAAKGLDEAARLMAEAKTHTGDTLELRVIQTRFWARQSGPVAAKALGTLATDLEKFDARAQSRLLGELAAAQYRSGNTQEATALWNRLALAPQNKNDLRLRLLLFDLALRSGDESAMETVLGELKRIEGDQGTLWRYASAARLIRRAHLGKTEGIDQARILLDAVAARRPEWATVQVAKADLEEARSNFDQAIANYRKAIQLGERSPRVLRQLVQLLYRQQRYEEADQEMKQLQRQAPDSTELQALQKLAVDISLQNQDPDRAVKLALAAVSSDSRDYRDHLWQGQVLAATGQQDAQAEKELRRAVELADTEPAAWLGLVQFLARKKKIKEAEESIALAAPKLPKDKAPLALAQCYELVGQIDKAHEQYQQAQSAKPDDVLVVRSMGAFYLRIGRLAEAEPLLRRVIDRKVEATSADVSWARRHLALALATRTDHRRLAEALSLVGLRLEAGGRINEDPARKSEDVDEQRARARVLATQSWREPRKQAIALLEQLSNRQALAPDDQFLLAQLYEADGNWPKARDLMQLVTGPAKNALYLHAYAQSLLRRRDLNEAERCINRLEQIEKTRRLAVGTLGSVELRAQLLEAREQGDKAIQLLKDYAGREDSRPERIFLLVGCMSRQKRHAEALALCQKARESFPPEMVGGATVATLRAMQPSEAQLQDSERWLKAECEKKPKSVALWMQLAELYDQQGRYAEVETACRKVLELDERNALVMNNLAWHLAQKPATAPEALTLINRAIELAGPRAELLDTRAAVHLALNRSELAIADLEAAIADAPTPPRYFHLAQAQRGANNAKEAAALLRKATTSGLKAEQLHPAERVAFLKLIKELEQR
ncbi:MAG: tetratricopeptide repeat protein [Gemmataceae bacterium]|nr:tetratricopeptide repeat protein [Gemmataceae bacterium]